MEEKQLRSDIFQFIADQTPGVVFLTSDLIEAFQLTQDEALLYITLSWKTGILEPRFRLFDAPMPWKRNRFDIPEIIDTPAGPKRVSTKDIMVGFVRTNL